MPQQSVTLSLAAAGTVAEVLIHEGDHVKAGQVILRLDAEHQQAGLAQAQAALQRAEAQLDLAKAGPRGQEIAAAQAAVDAAQAQRDRVIQGARPEDIAAAKALLASARADRQKTLEGADPEELAAAAAQLANAQAILRQAQAAYDRIKGNADAPARPESLALEQATNDLNAAVARYQRLQKGASAAALAKANAGVQQAQAQLNGVEAAPRAADLAAAEAEVRRAEAQLELTTAGSRPETISEAEAGVAAAEADVAQAQATVHDTELIAPFDGALVTLSARPGEQVAAGQPIGRLADLSGWQVETTNLTELNVVQVHLGQRASLTFDAIPGLELPGKVTAVRGLGENRQGETVYTVIVTPEKSDPRLRWNMTAVATFGE